MSDEVKTTELIKIGDVEYDKDAITPSIYFNYVKDMKQSVDHKEYTAIIDNTLKMIEKTKLTGQTEMAKELTHQLEVAIRELDAAKEGFDIFVSRKEIEKFIADISDGSVKIIELDRYTREIPDEVVEKLSKAKDIFDQIYIVYTDYSLKDTKKVAKERRDKDPIMFGAFIDEDANSSTKIYVEDRLFFIADWVEEKCDLTLEELTRQVYDKDKKEITYKITNPNSEDEAREFLNSLKKPTEELETVSLFERVKKAAKKATTRKKKSDKSTDEEKPAPKRRGRPKKSKTVEE